MQQINTLIKNYLAKLYMPKLLWTDVAEILIIAFILYYILLWIKNTKAWALLKGIFVIAVFLLIAVFFQMNTILWIVTNLFSIAAIAIVVVLQPELRRALEDLGRKNFIAPILSLSSSKAGEGRLSDRTINEIVKASVEMGRAKTGALIVVQNEQPLTDYERTGIDVDAIVSNQLLINIFEHNTPLHDGAVIIRDNRITSATCYLPLSDNMGLSKELGTRHRAGVGISEATDSMTVIVSEETGKISVAYNGNLQRGLDAERLRELLRSIQNKTADEKKRKLWKGRLKNEE
ncbi:MAG: diadenylate cyclase CdaA [Clostridiales bacterium]|nr:diadenylate cyclase CdaA [Clostridiales bacterium]